MWGGFDDFFFFKQETADDLRISDWSSDVCSSDLTVNVTSGTAAGTSNPDFGSSTIYVSADTGGATIVAGETIANGFGQYGIQVFSTGAVELTNGTVTKNGDIGNGISASGKANV